MPQEEKMQNCGGQTKSDMVFLKLAYCKTSLHTGKCAHAPF